jgi:general stress protein YciG
MAAKSRPSAASASGKRQMGFAVMDKKRVAEIASAGGKAAHQQGRAHEWTGDEARVAGAKGGVSVSRDRAHMAEIGRKGGIARGRVIAKNATAPKPPEA